MSETTELYGDACARLAELAKGLSQEELDRKVPGTPAWSVHDLIAHLAGGPADSLTGRMAGAPGPEWTAVHVSERAGLDVDTLLDELLGNAPAVQEAAEGNPRPAIVWDVSVHLADLYEALGLGRLEDPLWRPVFDGVGPYLLGERTLDVDDYEVFRGLFSRRSRAQMRAWGTELSDEELDELPIFGPRDDDQPIP